MDPVLCSACRQPLPGAPSSGAAPPCPACQGQPWYLAAGGKASDPLSWKELCGLAAAGRLRPEDRICRQGMSQWQPARAIGGLFAQAPAASEWYHVVRGRATGPVSLEQLRALAASGQLRPDDPVCRQGMSQWQPARTVAGLFAKEPAPATPPPAKQAGNGVPPAPKLRRRRWRGPALLAAAVALGILGVVLLRPVPPPPPGPDPALELAWQFEYDEDGSLTRAVDPAGGEHRIRSERDDKGRIRRRVEERPDGSQTVVTFDPLGQPVSISNPAGTIRRDHDGFGRLKTVRHDDGPVLAYDYDASGRVAEVRVGDTRLLRYTRDFLGRIVRLEAPSGPVTYEYPPGNDQVRRKLPNGVRTIWRNNPDGTLAFLEHVGPDDKLLLRFTYAYRPDHLVREAREETAEGKRTLTYDYDRMGRLTAVNDSLKGKTTYHYDQVGNRIEVSYPDGRSVAGAFDWAGRMTSLGGSPCKHDPCGNLVAYSRGSEEVAFTHGCDRRLTSAQTAAGKVRYQFDGDGRLVARSSESSTTSYLPDPTSDVWRPLLAREGDGKQLFYLWQDDLPLGVVEDGKAQFFLENRQGSVGCVTDAAGKVVARPDYDAFGVPQMPLVGGLQPGFAGLFYDPAAGLYLTRARAYDPALGRFLQRDPEHHVPSQAQEDLTAYVYCGNDPVNYLDSNGCHPADKVPYGSDLLSQKAIEYRQANSSWLSPGRNLAVFEYMDNGKKEYLVVPSAGQGRHSEAEGYRYLHRMGVDPKNVTKVYSEFAPCNLRGNECETKLQKKLPNADVSYSFEYGHTRESRKEGKAEKREAFQELGLNTKPGAVGGIRLRGIGDSLKDLGPLQGIALDANGRLVLITADKGDVALPPLRLEDVAVIFRAAYQQGEAPYVSIDPDKKDAHGPTMDIRHSPGTERTYVGWILFEADRVMKAYSLGYDNLENAGKKGQDMKPLRSSIAGYRSALELGFDDPPRDEKDKLWARFWIVPASVTRRHATRHEVTLLDVPLKVDTEPVVPKDGKLESVPGARSRPSDEAFARWFSEHYDDLAREVWSVPPPETGRTDKVPVFVELRRIALIAAVAERLRDQKVPLPSWVREYAVQPFPMPRTTPTITAQLKRKMGNVVSGREMFGGAVMSPRPEAVRTVAAPEADALAGPLFEAVGSAADFQVVSFQHEGKTYRAVALPGQDSKALGACRLDEADLTVPLPGDNALRLERTFSSFHRPTDVLGPGWTFDLPFVEVYKRVNRVEGKMKHFDSLYQLDSPLGTWSEFFGERKEVPEARVRPITVARSNGPLLGAWSQAIEDAQDNGNKVVRPVVDFRDGRRWYFDQHGRLAERHEPPLVIRYERDTQGRVSRIEGRYGRDARTAIELRYDDRGRLASATASTGAAAHYSYDAAGRLAKVERPGGAVGYHYRDGFVSEVLHGDRVIRRFEYTPQGELLAEQGPDGEKVVQKLEAVPEGMRVTTAPADHSEKKETVLYDRSYRPLEHVMPDGGRVEWKYEEQAVVVTVAPAGRSPLSVRRALDGSEEKWRLPAGGDCTIHCDRAGRPTEILADGRVVQRQEWRADGLPKLIEKGDAVYQPVYDDNGVPTRVLIRPRNRDAGSQGWMDLTFEGGRTTITDQGGEVVVMDANGRRLEWSPYRHPQTKEKKDRLVIRRDAQGRVEAVESSWGYRERNARDDQGRLSRVEITEAGQQAAVEFSAGRPIRMRQLDGGEILFSYFEEGPAKDKVREARLANDLVLTYEYDEQGRLAAVVCGGVYRLVYAYDPGGRLSAIKQVPCSG